MIKREGYFIRISIEKDKMKERRAINSHCTLLKFIFLEQCKVQSSWGYYIVLRDMVLVGYFLLLIGVWLKSGTVFIFLFRIQIKFVVRTIKFWKEDWSGPLTLDSPIPKYDFQYNTHFFLGTYNILNIFDMPSFLIQVWLDD